MESAREPNHHRVAELHPLTPQYRSGEHSFYFETLKKALGWQGEKAVRNIALTGSYGVGKSSILRQVANDSDSQVIQISLSTLGFGMESTPDGSTLGAAEDQTESSSSPNPLRDTKTNKIQKEIVKQLLYTQKPEKTPGSRYRRTSAFDSKRAAKYSLIAGIPVAGLFFLIGWTSKLEALFSVPRDWSLTANAAMVVVSAVFIFVTAHAAHNKIRVDSLSTGAATITLSANADTYFDEYLDEIVYFFQVVKADIIIFEDIDRFEDAHIFETLRELNTILNAAKQLDGRVIRFIYAIKDSIFEELGTRSAPGAGHRPSEWQGPIDDAATLVLARTNRTKFFDLVIPVIPFVTHQSARELMSGELADLTHEIPESLIDVVARHVADMRLIKNIRNEFVVFQEQVIRRSTLNLRDDRLFAMVLYKSTHLSDFELIKLGKSNLDTLYRDSRRMVQENVARLHSEITTLRHRLQNVNDQEARSEEVGNAVQDYVNLILSHTSFSLSDIMYDGTIVALDELCSADFWRKYRSEGGGLSFNYNNPHLGRPQASDLPRAELEHAIGVSLAPDQWESQETSSFREEIERRQRDLDFLTKADLGDLMARPDLKMRDLAGEYISLHEHAESLVRSKLAIDLLMQGHVDRYFTLYTSTFVGERVNANAMNFILKNVDPGVMDIHFPLTPAEAQAVLLERPRVALRGASAYNLDLVDFLLTDDSDVANQVLSNLSRGGEEEVLFLQAYLSSDRDLRLLVKSLTPSWASTLTFIAAADLDDNRRLKAMDVALCALANGLEYEVDESLREYLSKNFGALMSFTGAQSAETADRIAKLADAAGSYISDITLLGEELRRSIVEVGRFEVTRTNILKAISPFSDLALDSLQVASPSVYRRILEDLGLYLALLAADEVTIRDVGAFEDIVNTIIPSTDGVISTVVARSAQDCRVENLDDVATEAWPALARNKRFASNTENVVLYVAEYGIDENVAIILGSGTIRVSDSSSESEKMELAIEIIGGQESLPSPELRTSLVKSLALEEYIATSSIPRERGDLIGNMIRAGIVEDSPETMAQISDGDWEGREYAFMASGLVESYLSPDILPVADLLAFMGSSGIPESMKVVVAERYAEFTAGAEKNVLQSIAAFAVANNIQIPWPDIISAASAGIDRSLTLSLIQRYLRGATLAHLQPVLDALGGSYPVLSTPNGKRPRLPDTLATRALLERLIALGTVNSFKSEGSNLRVNMKRR